MDKETAARVYQLFALKVPTKRIVAETGADEAEVKRMRRAWNQDGRKAPEDMRPTPAAVVMPRELHTIPTPERSGKDAESDRRAFADPTMDGLLELANSMIEDYNASALLSDPRERIYARTVYGKNVAAVYRQIGEWAGLEAPPPETPVTNPVDTFVMDALKQQLKSWDHMEWEAMQMDPNGPEDELRAAVLAFQRRHHPTTFSCGSPTYADSHIIDAFRDGTATYAQMKEVLSHYTPEYEDDDLEDERWTTTRYGGSTPCSL